jgi:hypothetical protein
MATVYSINDILAVRWRGDHPEQAAAFKADWESIVDKMHGGSGSFRFVSVLKITG